MQNKKKIKTTKKENIFNNMMKDKINKEMHKATKEKIPEVKLKFLYQTGKHKINKR